MHANLRNFRNIPLDLVYTAWTSVYKLITNFKNAVARKSMYVYINSFVPEPQ